VKRPNCPRHALTPFLSSLCAAAQLSFVRNSTLAAVIERNSGVACIQSNPLQAGQPAACFPAQQHCAW
jgi:hypothetical protein